jgi:hypothetical protein
MRRSLYNRLKEIYDNVSFAFLGRDDIQLKFAML